MMTMAAHNVARVAGKGYYSDYYPDSLMSNTNCFGFKLNKFVGTDTDKYSIKRYFHRFKDRLMRADLAFAMIQLATRCSKRGLYAQYLCNPDMWYVVETANTFGVYFSGLCTLVKAKNRLYIDPTFKAILRTYEGEQLQYPSPLSWENYEDPLVYSMLLVQGYFDIW